MLPERIRTRNDKIGFRAEPAATWALAERNREALLANRTRTRSTGSTGGACADLFGGEATSAGAEFMLWRVINTKLWLRTFWDGGPIPWLGRDGDRWSRSPRCRSSATRRTFKFAATFTRLGHESVVVEGMPSAALERAALPSS